MFKGYKSRDNLLFCSKSDYINQFFDLSFYKSDLGHWKSDHSNRKIAFSGFYFLRPCFFVQNFEMLNILQIWSLIIGRQTKKLQFNFMSLTSVEKKKKNCEVEVRGHSNNT